MMVSLLSIFDPSGNWTNSMFVFIIISIIFIYFKYMYLFSSHNVLLSKLSKLEIFKGVKLNLAFYWFTLILFFNYLGMTPFSFSITSSFIFNISISFLFWSASMMVYMKNMESFLAHLTPNGAPLGLVPFLVLVELVSSMIRPWTLALRLMSNIVAGHLILSLLSLGISVAPALLFSYFVHSFFLIFELIVALIQAYVFSSLLLLYWKESQS